MPFSLTIVKGQEQGKEYTFTQLEVSIGRTAENDIVLPDQGVSRRHALVRDEGANRFTVQDLGSANGTKLNGQTISESDISDGDTLEVGPVHFAFAMMEADGNSTRIFDPAELERKKAETKKAKEVASKAAAGQQRAVTSMTPVVSGAAAPSAGRRAPVSRAGGAALATVPKGEGGGAVASASSRARARREAKGIGGKIALFWSEANPKVRMGIMVGGAVFGLLIVSSVVRSILAPSTAVVVGSNDESAVVFPLPDVINDDTFGVGSVGHTTIDRAQFVFNFPVTGKKATATLHFESAQIARPEDIDVTLNAVHQGFAPRSLGDQSRKSDIPLSPKHLKPNAANTIVFDQVKNPPGQEAWVIGRVWVEVTQLPVGTPEELKASARHYTELGDKKFEHAKIGGPNMFEAWSAYRKAKLYFDALEDADRPDEYDVIRRKIKDTERELDAICAREMFRGEALVRRDRWDEAIALYKSALVFFPSKEHSCNIQIGQALSSMGQ